MIYKWLNGLFLYQVQPSFIYIRKDILTWVYMQTGIPNWLIQSNAHFIFFDVLFYTMPLLLLLIARFKQNWLIYITAVMLCTNWMYVEAYTLFPINSIESYTAWLIIPVIFLAQKPATFQLLFKGLRYFFIFFFFSAGMWKFVQGGIFNINEMSGVLLYQHNQLLTNSVGYWQTGLISYLITHPALSYTLYAAATLIELSFMVGFFTEKYDRLLITSFLLFLLADYIVMRIPYFETLPWLMTLYFKPWRKKVAY